MREIHNRFSVEKNLGKSKMLIEGSGSTSGWSNIVAKFCVTPAFFFYVLRISHPTEKKDHVESIHYVYVTTPVNCKRVNVVLDQVKHSKRKVS